MCLYVLKFNIQWTPVSIIIPNFMATLWASGVMYIKNLFLNVGNLNIKPY